MSMLSDAWALHEQRQLAETMDLATAAGGSTLGSGAVALRLEADFQEPRERE